MKLVTSRLRVGLERPLGLLHVTDTHLSYADQRDDERKRRLAEARRRRFDERPEQTALYLSEMLSYARERGETVVHTGDLIDFVSAANLDKAGEALESADCFFVPGNHEFSQYVGEAYEDTTYKMMSYPRVRQALKRDLLFCARQISGLNLVGVDNSYYQFAAWQLERLRMETEKGLPILLAVHNPLFAQPLYDEMMIRQKSASAGLVGCDEAHLTPYDEYDAFRQRPDPDTRRFVDYVLSQPLIRAVVCGHLHFSFECLLPNGVTQYVTGGGFEGAAREILME